MMTGTQTKILVSGLGLMGGSLAKGLKKSGDWIVRGYDPDLAQMDAALAEGWIDEAAQSFSSALPDQDLVVLASPIASILNQLQEIPASPTKSSVVVDLGSTKRAICAAMEELPEGWQAIGGHPMTGRLTAGAAGTDANLYRGRKFVLTSNGRTGDRALLLVDRMLDDLGADRVEMAPDDHDRAVSLVSHLPHFLAAPLLLSVAEENNSTTWDLAAGGFRNVAAAVVDNPIMWRDIAATNRILIADSLDRLARNAIVLAEAMRNDPESMEEYLQKAEAFYENFK